MLINTSLALMTARVMSGNWAFRPLNKVANVGMTFQSNPVTTRPAMLNTADG